MDLNSNKNNSKSLTINYSADKNKINDDKQNKSYDLEVNQKKEIIKSNNNAKDEPNNEDKSEFKGKRIVIIKKKERKKNNNDNIAYKSNRNDKNELDKQKKNNITYDYIIDDDNIYYNDNKEYNENINHDNIYSLTKKDVHIIDGMDSLLNCINPVDFVKLAVQSSFFFSPSIVMERHEEMKRILNNHEPLSVRRTARKDKSEKTFKDENDGFCCPIVYDAFGNDVVIKLINHYTGYTIARNKSIFRNYVISHIWGEAKDPRYFTSFWNLVLIPAWANHLMDKTPERGSVSSILSSTIKRICFEVYPINKLDWEAFGGKELPNKPLYDVISNDYKINFLERKNANQIVGNRTQQTIRI
jgi:hypothetical protein